MKKIGLIVGFLLILLVAQSGGRAESTDSSESQGVGTNALMENPIVYLIRDEAIHKELKLSSEQKQKLRTMIVEMDETLWRMRELPDEGQGKQVWQRLHSELDLRLEKILEEEQNKRLREIVVRARGLRGLIKPDMVTYLKISPKQLEDMQAVIRKTAGEIKELQKEFAQQSPTKLEQQVMKTRSKENENLFLVLSNSQKKKFIARIGKNFDLSLVKWQGITAPEIRDVETWINSSPLTLEKLQGKVVALHFWAFG